MANIRRQYVQTPLGQVLVRTGGSGKPVFLLANTYLGSESFMRHGFLGRMADRYQVFAPDAIGQGDSDLPPHALSIPEHAQNLADVMDALGVPRASFIGSHTGATVAMELAVQQPERVDALIIAGLPLWTARQREKLAQMDRFKGWEFNEDGSYLTDIWQSRLGITHGLTPEEMHWQFMAFLQPGPRVHEPLHALFHYEPREQLPKVQARVLTLAGETDQFGERMHEIVEAIPTAKMAVLPPGTLLHSVDPDAFFKCVSEFIG